MMPFLLIAPKAIGPVWPAILLYITYMLATTVFLVLAWLRSYFKSFSLKELRFLLRLYDATEMVSTLAILTGMIGTCIGLLDVLPELSNSLGNASSANLLPKVLSPLRNVWASTIAGLAIGGLWGEILMFVLKPYTRPALLPVSHDEPPSTEIGAEPLDFDADEDEGEEDDSDVDDDWRQYDKSGIH